MALSHQIVLAKDFEGIFILVNLFTFVVIGVFSHVVIHLGLLFCLRHAETVDFCRSTDRWLTYLNLDATPLFRSLLCRNVDLDVLRSDLASILLFSVRVIL